MAIAEVKMPTGWAPVLDTLDQVKSFIILVILTLKAPPIICNRRQLKIVPLFQK